VASASVGYDGEAYSPQTSPATTVEVRAVDASTFAQTAIWTKQDSSQSLASLMALLAAQQKTGISSGTIPVIADANTLKKLGLQVGSYFAMQSSPLSYSSLNCVVIAEVQHIPTINDNAEA